MMGRTNVERYEISGEGFLACIVMLGGEDENNEQA
jgi:hypothetical protein